MASGTDPTADTPKQEGVSLDELAQAFAQVMGTAPRPPSEEKADEAQAGPALSGASPADESSPPAEPRLQDDCCPISPRSILEAMLFVGSQENRPLSAAHMAELMRGVEPNEIPDLVRQLNHHYTVAGCPYSIIHEDGGYRLALSRPLRSLRDRFLGHIREARLSQPAIDVLAIVAYQQPLSAEQLNTLRGKPSNHVLVQLVRRGLLRIERSPEKPRTSRYHTTDRFLKLFGLQTLADLPQSEELDRQ